MNTHPYSDNPPALVVSGLRHSDILVSLHFWVLRLNEANYNVFAEIIICAILTLSSWDARKLSAHDTSKGMGDKWTVSLYTLEQDLDNEWLWGLQLVHSSYIVVVHIRLQRNFGGDAGCPWSLSGREDGSYCSNLGTIRNLRLVLIVLWWFRNQ